MPRIDRYETTCRCGHEILTVSPAIDSHETRWVECDECGHVTPAEPVGPADFAALRRAAGGDA